MTSPEQYHITDINNILSENVNPVLRNRHKRMKKLDFFEELLNNTMKSKIYFNRSNKYVIKHKFYKSKDYNRFKRSYVDNMKQFQRSKSLEVKKYNTQKSIEYEGKLFHIEYLMPNKLTRPLS